LLNGQSEGLRALPAAPQTVTAGGLQPYVGCVKREPHVYEAGECAVSFKADDSNFDACGRLRRLNTLSNP
jgi:hypothetical protein